MSKASSSPSRASVALALGLVYVLWGSTYLGIRFAVETLPPFLMAGSRFFLAGALLYGAARLRGAPRPAPRQWGPAAVVGACLIVGGNGAVTFAVRYIDSGLAALLVAVVPMWMVLGGWLWRLSPRPGPATWAGLAAGFAGVALVVHPGAEAGPVSPHRDWGVAAVLGSSVVWTFGSLYAKRARQAVSPFVLIGMQMLCGGALLLLLGALLGEGHGFTWAAVSARSAWAFAYLLVFGSVIGFTAYAWLLIVAPPALVGTYAFVNPVVAVALGAWLGGERLSGSAAWGAALIVAAVAVLILRQPKRPSPPVEEIAP